MFSIEFQTRRRFKTLGPRGGFADQIEKCVAKRLEFNTSTWMLKRGAARKGIVANSFACGRKLASVSGESSAPRESPWRGRCAEMKLATGVLNDRSFIFVAFWLRAAAPAKSVITTKSMLKL